MNGVHIAVRAIPDFGFIVQIVEMTTRDCGVRDIASCATKSCTECRSPFTAEETITGSAIAGIVDERVVGTGDRVSGDWRFAIGHLSVARIRIVGIVGALSA